MDFILLFYCLIMAAAYPTLCCYSLNGFDGCIPGCVTLATHLYLSVALCGFIKYIRLFEETAFLLLGAYNGDIPVQVVLSNIRGLVQYKDASYQYRKSHCVDKMI